MVEASDTEMPWCVSLILERDGVCCHRRKVEFLLHKHSSGPTPMDSQECKRMEERKKHGTKQRGWSTEWQDIMHLVGVSGNLGPIYALG